MNLFWIIGAVLFAVAIEADTFSTLKFIKKLGLQYEGNKLQRAIYRKWGKKGFFIGDFLAWCLFTSPFLFFPPSMLLFWFFNVTTMSGIFFFHGIRNTILTKRILERRSKA